MTLAAVRLHPEGFANDPSAIGATLLLVGERVEIIGPVTVSWRDGKAGDDLAAALSFGGPRQEAGKDAKALTWLEGQTKYTASDLLAAVLKAHGAVAVTW